ncbi:MAG TPA: carbohydrate kinase family protein [Propionibacteriaceae bacterium]|nr:carbohydrate kinase family protein [Propionibacteriaceae bacterium]
MTGVLGTLGDLVEDIVVGLSEPLEIGTDAAGEITRTRGGSAANVAAAAAQLGQVPARYLGCVGTDAAGDGLVAGLLAQGVDVRTQRRGCTGAVVILVEPGGERTMVPNRGASILLEPVEDAWLDGLSMLHVPAYSLCAEPIATSALDALRRVRERGTSTSIDASSVGTLRAYGRERIRRLLTRLAPDHLLANADEAAFLGLDEADYLPRTTLVVKHGSSATRVRTPDGAWLSVPVSPVVDVLDSTGAGDAFAAGYLSAVVLGQEPEAACSAGNAWAAHALSRAGAL